MDIVKRYPKNGRRVILRDSRELRDQDRSLETGLDHVHLFVLFPSRMSILKLVGKRNSFRSPGLCRSYVILWILASLRYNITTFQDYCVTVKEKPIL